MSNSLKLGAEVGVAGVFQNIQVLDREGRVKRETGAFQNLITNAGLTRLATTSASLCNWCRVGTGSTAPAFTDTALENQIASHSTSNAGRGANVAEGYCFANYTWTFPVGAVVGNISEIGTGWASDSNNTLFSRALILDALGNPTTITLLADEQLRVSWQQRRYWPTHDTTGTLVNEGNRGGTYSWTVRPAVVGSWEAGGGGMLGDVSGFADNSGSSRNWRRAPSELSGIENGPVWDSLNSGSSVFSVAGPLTSKEVRSLTISQNNVATGLQTVVFTGGASGSGQSDHYNKHAFQVRFDPPLMKTSSDILEVDFTLTWARV